jgi:hypothetical protein
MFDMELRVGREGEAAGGEREAARVRDPAWVREAEAEPWRLVEMAPVVCGFPVEGGAPAAETTKPPEITPRDTACPLHFWYQCWNRFSPVYLRLLKPWASNSSCMSGASSLKSCPLLGSNVPVA